MNEDTKNSDDYGRITPRSDYSNPYQDTAQLPQNSSNKKHENSSFWLEKEIFSSEKKNNDGGTPGSNWRNLLTPNKKSFFGINNIEDSNGKTSSRDPISGHKDSLGRSKLYIRNDNHYWIDENSLEDFKVSSSDGNANSLINKNLDYDVNVFKSMHNQNKMNKIDISGHDDVSIWQSKSGFKKLKLIEKHWFSSSLKFKSKNYFALVILVAFMLSYSLYSKISCFLFITK